MKVYCIFEYVEGREYDSWDELREIFDTMEKAEEYLKSIKYSDDFSIEEWEVK